MTDNTSTVMTIHAKATRLLAAALLSARSHGLRPATRSCRAAPRMVLDLAASTQVIAAATPSLDYATTVIAAAPVALDYGALATKAIGGGASGALAGVGAYWPIFKPDGTRAEVACVASPAQPPPTQPPPLAGVPQRTHLQVHDRQKRRWFRRPRQVAHGSDVLQRPASPESWRIASVKRPSARSASLQ